jgi:hypothetical protein
VQNWLKTEPKKKNFWQLKELFKRRKTRVEIEGDYVESNISFTSAHLSVIFLKVPLLFDLPSYYLLLGSTATECDQYLTMYNLHFLKRNHQTFASIVSLRNHSAIIKLQKQKFHHLHHKVRPLKP